MATFYHKVCGHCSSEFSVIARNKKQKFCCSECAREARKPICEPLNCITCDTPLNSREQKKFCSHSCSAVYYNKIRPPVSEETKEKLRQAQYRHIEKYPRVKNPKAKINTQTTKQCKVCDKTYTTRFNGRKTCSEECMRKSMSIEKTKYLKDPENRKKYKGRRGKSYMEATFEQWLLDNGITNGLNGFITELHFFNPETNKHGWADFAFPKLKLIIELDGTHHLKRKELDEIRDAYLRSKGYSVLRITINEYMKYKWIDNVKTLLNIS